MKRTHPAMPVSQLSAALVRASQEANEEALVAALLPADVCPAKAAKHLETLRGLVSKQVRVTHTHRSQRHVDGVDACESALLMLAQRGV